MLLVSYNLRSYGKSNPGIRQGQHELLRALHPDVVCLQEIYAQGGDLAELGRLTAEIADAVGMRNFPVPAVHSDCHLAVLWKPEYRVLSARSYDLLMWHGLGIVRLDVDAGVPLTVAVTHLGPWNPTQQLADTFTVTGKLPITDATVLAADWNSFGVDPGYDREPDWTSLPPDWIARHVRWTDDPTAPPVADRRPAQLMHRSGWHDAALTLGVPWQPTGGDHGGWGTPGRREDVFWTTRPAALRTYRVIDRAAARELSERSRTPVPDPSDLSDHFPIAVTLQPAALSGPSLSAVAERAGSAGRPR